MKIDRSKLKKGSSEIPADCKALIEKLKSCNQDQLLVELKNFKSWTCGKCELYYWADILDKFDEVLERCCKKENENQWSLPCDSPDMEPKEKDLLLSIISFTALLIEHSFSRHSYSSMDHLITLLTSSDMQIVLAVLGLLFVFSKRSNFINKLSIDKRAELLTRLSYLAESWGGKENGFGLAKCCLNSPMSSYPSSATTLHYEYYTEHNSTDKKSINVIHIDNVDQIKNESIASIMETLIATYDVPRDKQMQLFTHLRLAHCFSDPVKRMQCVQARLQAMSVIVYYAPPHSPEIGTQLLYNGFIEELVDILKLDGNNYIDIKSAALRTLTAIVNSDRNSRLSNIIDSTESSSYHGFLPVLVRNCIQSLINNDNRFPIPYATALFSFLYHLASYEKGGEALVSCGMMESLLKIISWTGTESEHITFVTRSVRVIDLITNIDMTVFQAQSGLNIFIERLEAEVKICRKELKEDLDDVEMNQNIDEGSSDPMDVDSPQQQARSEVQCYTQRAALLKSMLNFLKKAVQHSTFSDCIRHLMDGSLPKSLRHIISNANYYGSSLFLLSIELVSAYVFQEPALLSSLQESQLTKDILDAILEKPLPPTREILAALPNTFSALCLNNAGLQAFQARKPFEKFFRVLISADYLQAMKRRKADLANDTATNLGNSMDELMRHQPSLRADVIAAIINLLNELCRLGEDPNYVCCTKLSGKLSSEQLINNSQAPNDAPQQNNANEIAVFSDDEDDDDEDSASPPVAQERAETKPTKAQAPQNETAKIPVPLVEYILNVMRFVDAILTNNSTDDHVREFLRQDGLVPLLKLMRLENLPIDFPTTQACGGVSSVCRSILALARDPKVVQEALKSFDEVLEKLKVFNEPTGNSVLFEEYNTPLLHSMSAAHAYVVLFSCINRSNSSDTRNICINHWGKDLGLDVLKKMSKLYLGLVWESTIFITLGKGDQSTQAKIKPLVSSTSRLAKGLAELFVLLVKLSVGSPVRHRRSNQAMSNTPIIPSTASQNVTTVFADLITKGLKWDSSSVLKHRYTFFILFSGFTQTMLFDERKNAFHLMLRDFVNREGLEAFFDIYQSLNTDGAFDGNVEENPRSEFLDSWLSLLEEMVNSKLVLKTPHTMAPKSNTAVGYTPFDSIQYLIKVHKHAYKVIDSLWKIQPKKCFNDQTSDHILSIFCHLLKGETIIKEHLSREKESESNTTNSTMATSTNPVQSIDVNQEHMQHLIDMGFTREAAIDALQQCQTIEQATEFLLATPQASSNWPPRSQEGTQDVDMATEEITNDKKPLKEEPLSKEEIDKFTEDILPGALRLMDEIPSTVYKVCDLIVTVAHRNGKDWCNSILNELLSEIISNASKLIKLAEPLRDKDSKPFEEWASQLKNAVEADKVAVRVHLYTLLFEERKIQCAHLIHKSDALSYLIKLLQVELDLLPLSKSTTCEPSTDQTPKWLAPTILLIDLYEKGAVASKRRAPLIDNQRRTWLYFDERSARWMPHMPLNNQIIDDAYKNGEQYARYSLNRKHYLAQFSSMMQINEDTSNLRPIMMTLTPITPENQNPNIDPMVPKVEKLEDNQKRDLLDVSVRFMELPIDSNSLEAVMRLSFRLTREYKFAKYFSQIGGIKAIQELRDTSQFPGFESLSTLIIRHVIEDPAVLSQTMEKVIRSTTQHCHNNQREIHNLLRTLGAAACRNEEIFKKLAIEILRITPPPLSQNDDDSRPKSDVPQIIKLLPPKPSDSIKATKETETLIKSLLNSLTVPHHMKSKSVRFNTSPASSSLDMRPSAICDQSSQTTTEQKEASFEPTSCISQTKHHNPLMNHSIVLRLLAELTRSYSVVPKIIADFKFNPATNTNVKEEVSALAFILDNILPSTQTHSDRDGPPLARVFLAALAACNHCVDAQNAIVTEVKKSLNRAASLPESCEKHARLQSLATIINTMIECCPAISSQPPGSKQTSQQQISNNIVRLFVRKGLVTDLARIPHSLDLSAPHMFATINAVLKPLETLSKFVNLPDQPGQTRDQAPPAKKPCSSSSSSSELPEDEDNGEVSGVDEREEDADDDDDDDDDDDEDEDQDHVDDDEDHVDDDEADDDENLNAFGENHFVDDYRIYNGQLNNVLNDIEEVFLQSNNVIYSERLNTIMPNIYDEQQHESSAPTLPPPPGNVGANHPLLLRRLDHISNIPILNSVAPPVISRHRYGRPRLLRGAPVNNSQWHGVSASRHPPQTILQQLLGPNTVQEVMSITNQIVGPGRLFVADFQNWLATEDELYPDSADPQSLTSTNATALASIPLVMARWTEESRILDGGTLHDCVSVVKLDIVAALEKFRDEENLERQEKRRKMIEDEEKIQQKKPKDPAPESMNITPSEEVPSQPVVVELQSDQIIQDSPIAEEQNQDNQPAQMQVSEEPPQLVHQAEEHEPQVSVERPPSPPQLPAQEQPPAQPEPPVGSNEIPEGIDPSFLEALPEEIRQEVLAEQWRLRRIERSNRQPGPSATAAPTEQPSTSSANAEISPDFLAALPPDVQEEVLAQQRAEQQQREAAINPNPDQPVDPANFIQGLAPNLRRQVLADMDDSILPLLPSDLAAEAQALRRELLTRDAGANSTLSRLLRTAAAGRISRARYTITSVPDHVHSQQSWSWALDRSSNSLSHPSNSNRNLLALSRDSKFKGVQALDCEALTCLLIQLFVEEPRLNIARLHRLIRNLCYHQQTRQWVVQSILSIVDRAKASIESSKSIKPKKGSKSDSPSSTEISKLNHNSSWLSISMDAALGCRASVFAVQKGQNQTNITPQSIYIHSQAAPSVCRHMLEALIALAKSFPHHFFPESLQPNDETGDSKALTSPMGPDFWEILAKLDSLSSINKKGKSSKQSSTTSSMSSQANTDGSVGETIYPLERLMKFLDHPVIKRSFILTDRLLHLLAVIASAFPVSPDEDTPWRNPPLRTPQYARRSPHGRAWYAGTHHGALHRPFSIHHQPQQQQLPPPPPLAKPAPTPVPKPSQETQMSTDKPKQPLVREAHLKLAVEVLTSKSCSEEGLDDVTSMLFRLSKCCPLTKATVLELLMRGATHLGNTVCQHISILKTELNEYNQKLRNKATNTSPGTKGVVHDRFTSDSVIITAPTSSKSGREVQLPSMANLTSKNSSQAFFLRILKVIIHLRGSNTTAPVPPQPLEQGTSAMDVEEEPSQKQDESLSIELDLDSLWETLSECLFELAETPDHHAVLVLQPAVEAFFLVHSPGSTQKGNQKHDESNTERNNQTSHIDQEVAPISPHDNSDNPGSSSTQKFLKFAEKHRVVLNHILRQSTTPLIQGPFAVLVDHTRVLDFDVKRRYFRQELERLDEGIRRDDLGIHVRRDHVFEESFRELHRRSAEEWKNRFFVVFEDEEGQDAGGLLREWYTIISREIFNPMYALFTTSPGDRVTYMINSSSHCNAHHLVYFKFVGRVIAKAIYDNKLLDCYFTRSFYKHILGKPVKYTDMESEDYSYYQSLVFLLEHDVKELGYELPFTVEVREFGVTETREIKPNGANISVTEENKHEYVRLVCQEKMTGSIRKQLSAFLEGFYDIIPKRLISIFNEQELELLISGLPNIDIDDLKANTEYHKYLPNSLQIQWFWRALRSFDQADRAKLLQFVTGTSKVPLQGFASLEGMNGVQKFQIHRDERLTDRLPSAHTCFNQLDLPVYETYDKLRKKLLEAIQMCSEGFGLA